MVAIVKCSTDTRKVSRVSRDSQTVVYTKRNKGLLRVLDGSVI